MKTRFALLGLVTLLLSGCALDTLVDCRNLCERTAECFDTDADIDGCTTRCESRVEAGDDDQADRCDSCLDEQDSCVGATLACGAQCGPLLAP